MHVKIDKNLLNYDILAKKENISFISDVKKTFSYLAIPKNA